jgi:hypothetical protein
MAPHASVSYSESEESDSSNIENNVLARSGDETDSEEYSELAEEDFAEVASSFSNKL